MRMQRGILLALLFASSTFAAEYNREVTVGEIVPNAAERPALPQSKNLIRIYVNTGSWGISTCRGDAADLKADDKHLLSILLTGWATGKLIRIGVDDSLRPVDTVCQVVWLSAR